MQKAKEEFRYARWGLFFHHSFSLNALNDVLIVIVSRT